MGSPSELGYSTTRVGEGLKEMAIEPYLNAMGLYDRSIFYETLAYYSPFAQSIANIVNFKLSVESRV